MELSQEQLANLIDLLKRSKRFLSDASSPRPNFTPCYASLAGEIEDALEEFGLESE